MQLVAINNFESKLSWYMDEYLFQITSAKQLTVYCSLPCIYYQFMYMYDNNFYMNSCKIRDSL